MEKIDVRNQKKAFGRQLWECRQELGLTLEEVSQMLHGGLKPRTIERFEIGVVPFKDLSILNQLCRFYKKKIRVTLE